MNSTGTVYIDGAFEEGRLFVDPFFATGYPITEAYWARVKVGGELRDVLLQCFERRCLTYTPDNAPEWRVEAGNVGLHYHDWRYGSSPDVVPAGNRILEINVNETANVNFPAALALAKAAGAQSVSLSIDWNDFETVPGVFRPADDPENWLTIANLYYPGQEMKVSFFIRPVVTLARAVPDDLADTAWDDPVMIARFKAFLDHVFALIPDLDLNVVSIGSEHDIRFGNDAETWQAFTTFFTEAKQHIEQLSVVQANWPDLDIGSEMTFNGLAGEAASHAADLNSQADALLVSYYPLDGGIVRHPSVVHDDFQMLSDLAAGKPIYFMQAGYPSGYYPEGGYDGHDTTPVLGSSPEKQAEFIREIFRAWDTYASQIRLLDLTWMHDLSPEQAFELANNDPAFAIPGDAGHLEFLWTLGLRTYAGEEKPAWQALVEEAAARGW